MSTYLGSRSRPIHDLDSSCSTLRCAARSQMSTYLDQSATNPDLSPTAMPRGTKIGIPTFQSRRGTFENTGRRNFGESCSPTFAIEKFDFRPRDLARRRHHPTLAVLGEVCASTVLMLRLVDIDQFSDDVNQSWNRSRPIPDRAYPVPP